MSDISKQYEKALTRLLNAYSKRIQQIYFDAINEITLFASVSTTQLTQDLLLLNESILDASPALKIKLEKVIEQMQDSIFKTVTSSINQSWGLSNQKNDAITNLITTSKLPETIKSLIYNPHQGALNSFLKRKNKGLNLSERVFRLTEPFKYELEAGIQDGISKGRSAANMARDIKRNLNEPERLFMRVRDENGNLKLSQAAKAYNPGQGVYRSSYKNALRLTGTETNIAYKSSDHERWKDQFFTKGIEIRLSNNHPKCDLCNKLVGVYPKAFKFTGWHPKCRCYAVPLLMTDEEYSDYEDYNLGITKKKPTVDQEQEIPIHAKEWIRNNANKLNNLKSKPYWIADNTKFVKPLLKKKK